jgi:predicted Zn-dependent protease with MMP-like domain
MTRNIPSQAELKSVADDEIQSLIRKLPRKLHAKLSDLAVILEFRPGKNYTSDGVEEDSLGLFTGSSLMDGDQGSLLPKQIILFLENIFEEAEDRGRGYRAELRRTFLHELGHYLGLEENDLKLRNVD